MAIYFPELRYNNQNVSQTERKKAIPTRTVANIAECHIEKDLKAA